MRARLIVGLIVLCTAKAALSLPAPRSRWAHTLPLSSGAMSLVATALERSSIVTTLLEALEETDVVVYIADLLPGSGAAPSSYLAFLSRDAAARYLLIRIDHWRLSPPERIALLAHELQHALEIASAPEVQDSDGLRRLYRRVGWEGGKDRFESEAAQIMGNRVRRELAGRTSARAAPTEVASPVGGEAAGQRPRSQINPVP